MKPGRWMLHDEVGPEIYPEEATPFEGDLIRRKGDGYRTRIAGPLDRSEAEELIRQHNEAIAKIEQIRALLQTADGLIDRAEPCGANLGWTTWWDDVRAWRTSVNGDGRT